MANYLSKHSGAQIDEAVDKVLNGEVGAVEVDETLTVPGAAADAKAVGDRLGVLYEEKAKDVAAEDVEEDGDLFVTDSQGNALVKFSDGHVQTKNFNSANAAETVNTNTADDVFDITDASGNVIVRFKDGYIYTKKVDTTNPYELPGYYHENGYIDAKCARIRELMAQTGGDAFFFCTDQHVNTNGGKGNARQAHKLMHYIAEKCRVNKLFLGGDMTDGIDEKAADEFREAMNGRSYACAGNHEYMSSVTEENIAYYLSSGLDDEVSGDPLRRYFYVDNPKHKIRYIVTNGFVENGNGSWDWGLEQTQLDWLNNTALNVESGWTIVVFTHMVYGVVSETDSTLVIESRHRAFLDLLDAYTGSGTIAAVICGHTHLDAIKATTGGIPVLITCCDKWFPYNGMEAWLHGRVPGTITEQCFDVCVVDSVNRKIYAVRIGGFATDDDANDAALMEAGERTVSY